MKVFLRLKHWQLFLLLIGVPLLLDFALIGSLLLNKNINVLFIVFPILMLYVITVFFGWFYSLGINLNCKLPETVNINLTRFKIFLFIPVAYMLFLIFFMFGAMINDNPPSPMSFLFIVPLHLFSMFCIFYCLYFISKSLKAVELQRDVTFSDYAGEFFLIWFFPIGVWFIQPRINKVFAEDK